MFILRSCIAVRVAACITVMMAGLSCDALNPSFVNQLGGNANVVSPKLAGSIVVVFNNQRSTPLQLSYETEITRPGDSAVTLGGGNIIPDSNLNDPPEPGYFAVTLDCNTTMIKITGIGQIGSDEGGAGSLALASNEFRAPALQCGSVLFVNVPIFGSPTAELVP